MLIFIQIVGIVAPPATRTPRVDPDRLVVPPEGRCSATWLRAFHRLKALLSLLPRWPLPDQMADRVMSRLLPACISRPYSVEPPQMFAKIRMGSFPQVLRVLWGCCHCGCGVIFARLLVFISFLEGGFFFSS
jgi:hypothetical protein